MRTAARQLVRKTATSSRNRSEAGSCSKNKWFRPGKVRLTFVFSGDEAVTSVEFKSSGTAFEVAQVATAAAVPEPSTWAMMLLGFGLLGNAGWRRGKTAIGVV